MSIKNSIIDTLKKENLKLQDKVKELEKKLSVLNEKSNNFNQYNNRQNNLEIQTIPANVPMKKLEQKLINIFSCPGIAVVTINIENYHRSGKTNPKNTIIKFVNHKFCYKALKKKLELDKLDRDKLGFNKVKKLYFSENWTPFNQ